MGNRPSYIGNHVPNWKLFWNEIRKHCMVIMENKLSLDIVNEYLENMAKCGFRVMDDVTNNGEKFNHLLSKLDHDDYMLYSSGGGFFHAFLHLKNKKVVSIHFCEFNVELSYKEWDSLDEYLDGQDNQDGFGFEYDYPNWEDRILGDNWTIEDCNKLFKN